MCINLLSSLGKIIYALLATIILNSCSNKPSEEDFKKIIVGQGKYPIKKETTIDTRNVYLASEFQKQQIDESGYVTIDNSSARITDTELKQHIIFTEKAKPFLIGDMKEEGTELNQRIALYNIEFNKITGVKFNTDENKAIVEIEDKFVNVSPFANLFAKRHLPRIKEGQARKLKVPFSKYDDGWRIEQRPSAEFNNF